MNCFAHLNAVAVVYCKECNKPLCLDCAQQDILGQRRVCSEVCSKLASLRPAEEKEDNAFDRAYASVFIVLLLAVLGGIFVAWAGQSAMIRQKRLESGEYLTRWERRRNRPNDMTVLYYLGITDWRVQFAIGAAIGAGSGLLYVRKNVSRRRKMADEDLIS
jgi:hypothetical protein